MHLAQGVARDVSLFSQPYRSVSIGSIGLCSMIAFEAIGVAAGMPAVAASLHGVPLYALAFGGTLAGSVVAMVWSGYDCDRHGPFRSMALGMLLFAAGLLVAGTSGSMPILIIGRVVQGLGVGALGVALYVAAARALPSELHPRLFALFSSAWVVPALIGPAISGWIVGQFGWRWLFLGVLVLLLPTAALILPPLRTATASQSIKARSGLALSWSILAAISTVGLSISAWAERWAPLAVIVSFACMVLAASKLLPSGTLRMHRGLPTVIALRGLNSSAFFLSEAFVPLWLHQQRGWSITAAGIALTGGALCWSIGSHLQSRLRDEEMRQSWLTRGCLGLVAGIAICAMTVLGLLPAWMILIGWSLAGLGVGISLPMLGVLMLKFSDRDQQGNNSSALQLCAALGTSAALASGGLTFALLQEETPTLAFASVYVFAILLAITAWSFTGRTHTVRGRGTENQSE